MPLIELNMILDCEEEVKEVGFYTPLEYRVLDRKQLLNGIKKEIKKVICLTVVITLVLWLYMKVMLLLIDYEQQKKRKNKIITDWKEDCLTIH